MAESNLKILKINKEKGVVEETGKKVTEEEAQLLKKLCGSYFDLERGYIPPGPTKELVNDIDEKCGNITKFIPINFVDCRKDQQVEPKDGPGLDMMYGNEHTRLIVKVLSDGKTVIYVMDSFNNGRDETIEKVYGDRNKYVIRYPETWKSIEQKERFDFLVKKALETGIKEEKFKRKEVEEVEVEEEEVEEERIINREDMEEGRAGLFIDDLWIQKDESNCISYATHFARKIYKAVKDGIGDDESEESIINCFNKIMGELESYKRISNEYEKANDIDYDRNMFIVPNFLLKYSGSEVALDEAIKVLKSRGGDAEKLEKELKEKILPYKKRRNLEFDAMVKKESSSLEEELIKMLDHVKMLSNDEVKNKEEIKNCEKIIKEQLKNNDIFIKNTVQNLREKFSVAQNWRNKDLKIIAQRVAKEMENSPKENDLKKGEEAYEKSKMLQEANIELQEINRKPTNKGYMEKNEKEKQIDIPS
ncbi:MAG: hypothetical protein LBB13_00395 [Rickettsiales bacterium]|jgi:hypothetical protein|nr:hypothetical protein [Rickettsiales bacterium]